MLITNDSVDRVLIVKRLNPTVAQYTQVVLAPGASVSIHASDLDTVEEGDYIQVKKGEVNG